MSLRGRWRAELPPHGGGHSVRLICPAARNSVPQRVLVRITSEMIGAFVATDLDHESSQLVSFSSHQTSVEALVLMQPFGWVRGRVGSLTLLPAGRSFRLQVVRWE